MKRYNIEFWLCVFCLLVWRGNLVCGASGETLFGETVEDKSTSRTAAVYFSDGKVLTGKISLTPGRSFKLNIPRGGTLKTKDMVTGEDVQYGKVRNFTFEPVREIRFYPEKEEMRRSWKFIETTKYNEKTGEADYSPAAKEYSGRPYPLRYLAATVIFNSDESLQGHLYTATVYLKTKEKTHRLVLRSKQRGKEGASLDELVYVSRIKLLDKGKNIAAKVNVKFSDMRFGPEDTVQAVTKESLTPIPTTMTENDDTCVVESAFGEEFYLAARKDGKYIVGWPKEQDKKLFAIAQDHIKRQRDFYNEKKLLGVLEIKGGNEVLTLVNLRRKVASTHFGDIGGEWDRELGGVVEPWRLSIWRWKYDRINKELILSSRGTFFRVILLPENPTPEVVISEKLWELKQKGDTVIVGQSPKIKP
ncbi:MAG: hypothetical protein HQ580_10915 [Planctomycetes bacterium]|nr:hypothetical protein [Planctomycetota bacterium]